MYRYVLFIQYGGIHHFHVQEIEKLILNLDCSYEKQTLHIVTAFIINCNKKQYLNTVNIHQEVKLIHSDMKDKPCRLSPQWRANSKPRS